MPIDNYGQPKWIKAITPEFLQFLKEKAGQVGDSLKIPAPISAPPIDLIKYREIALLPTQRIYHDNHNDSN